MQRLAEEVVLVQYHLDWKGQRRLIKSSLGRGVWITLTIVLGMEQTNAVLDSCWHPGVAGISLLMYLMEPIHQLRQQERVLWDRN